MAKDRAQYEYEFCLEEIGEYAKLEGEAENCAQFCRPGSLWHRFWLWMASIARRRRLKEIQRRDELRAEITQQRNTQ